MQSQSRRKFLKTIGLGAVSAATLSLLPGCENIPPITNAPQKRPNILFLFTDDQQFDAISTLGNKHIITPNMDRLVRQGTTFTNAYIMGSMSGAVCMPSRAMLMTGRTLFRLYDKGKSILPQDVTLPELLRQAGYTTFATGKQHNGRAVFTRGFSTGSSIFFGGMSDHLKVPVYDFDPTGKYPKKSRYIAKKFSSELFSDAATDFLRSYKQDKPFFVYVSYTAPHDPRMAPKKYQDMYDPTKIPLPKNFMPEHPFDNGEMEIRDEKLAPWPRTPDIIRRHIADYYAMITHLDAQIGRVLDALEETGRAENTIIVFAGDNGLALGRHGLMGKQNLYEHSVRVPLIMSGPGIGKDKKCGAFCYLLDIFPTLCDLADLPIPHSVEGGSLMPAMHNSKKKPRQTLFFAYKDIQRAVRDKRYKLIEYFVKGQRTTQLFDLRNDPLELHNLARNRKYAPHLKQLRTELLHWKNKLQDNSKF